MTLKPSLITRIGVGKAVGLIAGLIGFFLLPTFGFDSLMVRFGFLFWYITLGAIVAIFGVLDLQPVLKFHVPWWACGILTGAWMNFVLTLFAFGVMAPVMAAHPIMGFTSPWWMVLDGAIFGLIAGGLATWIGGEHAVTAPARA